jgi:hypothetical protein
MSGGMPYHWEKGVVNLLLEQQFNRGRAELSGILRTLLDATGAENWVLGVLPEFEEADLEAARHQTGRQALEHFCEHWLGMDSSAGDGSWTPRRQPGDRTGYWVSYTGNVEQIVRKTLIWAFELALGLERGEPPETYRRTDPPHRIELFNVCPFPWFEGWVVRRPVDASGRGLISICWLTPSHVGSVVAESPVAHQPSAAATAFEHAVPSFEDDYELLDCPWDHPRISDRPRVKAADRQFATWVVTHRTHQPTTSPLRVDDSTMASGFGEWTLPRTTTYEGVEDIVIVAPSLAAGGITHDGIWPPSATAPRHEGAGR